MSILQPNMMQTESRMSRISDKDLANIIQSLTAQGQAGTPEYIIAAGEIQARKNLRQATDAQTPQRPPVLAELLSGVTVQPQADEMPVEMMQLPENQGIGALPAPNMEKMDEYAGGGIVAFDDGGEVQRFQNRGVVRGDQLSLFPELAAEAAAEVPESRRASFANALRKMFGMKGLTALSGLYPLYELHSTGMDYDTGMGFGTPEEQMTIGTIPPSPRVRPVDKAAQEKAAKEKTAAPAPATEKAPPVIQPPSSDVAKEEAGLGSLVDKFYGPTQKAKSLQDITQERLALYKQLGIQEDPYAAAREALQKDRATDAEARREAGWSRLLEAGLGIMGGESPYALTNIGKGAQAAAKGLSEDMKEFRKIERERKKAETDYNIASNAYRKSGADTDLVTAEKERARIDNLNMKRADAGMTVAVEQLKLKAQREGRLEDRDLKLYLGALERAGAFVKNNIDASTMSLDELEKLVDSYAASIYSKYKAGNITAGMSGATAVPSNVKVSREK